MLCLKKGKMKKCGENPIYPCVLDVFVAFDEVGNLPIQKKINNFIKIGEICRGVVLFCKLPKIYHLLIMKK